MRLKYEKVIHSEIVNNLFGQGYMKKSCNAQGSSKYYLFVTAPFYSVPGMALIQSEINRPQVFTAKCSEPQVGTSNGMDEGSGVTKFLSLRTET